MIVPDNLKAAVVRAAFVDDDPLIQRSYRELARHYGFQIDPTPPRSPEKKGKVEAGVRYVSGNFLRTWESTDIVQDQAALERWTMEVSDRARAWDDGSSSNRALRRSGALGADPAAEGALRDRDLEAGAATQRQPRAGRWRLLLRALEASASGPVGALHEDIDRDLARGRTPACGRTPGFHAAAAARSGNTCPSIGVTGASAAARTGTGVRSG
ncbi:MAG: hypothetical protein IPK67_06510 [Planctomycetes bacterium]|nr:hypothetical protein [Planctomycetota bacterium]